MSHASLQTYYIQQGAVVSLGHVTSTGVARLRGKGVESVAMEINHQGKVEIFVKKSLKRLGKGPREPY